MRADVGSKEGAGDEGELVLEETSELVDSPIPILEFSML
jgi:hypothetical protein